MKPLSRCRSRAIAIPTFAAIAIVGVNLFLAGSASPVSTAQAPAQLLNLTDWSVTMPYDANGKQFEPGVTPGVAVEITQPALATFSDPNYFYVNQADDGVVFMAPANGAVTANTAYPRTELRQMAGSSGTSNASWKMDSKSTNSETVAESIQHLPEAKPQVVVAQIHDSSHDIIEVLADATGTHGSAYDSDEPNDCSGSNGDIDNAGCQFDICYRYEGTENQSQCLIDGYTIGNEYSLSLSVKSDVITLSASYNGKTSNIKITDKSSKDATGDYFKAGCYTQSNVSTEGNYVDYGEDTIYSLSTDYNP
jgi:Alginate lyase